MYAALVSLGLVGCGGAAHSAVDATFSPGSSESGPTVAGACPLEGEYVGGVVQVTTAGVPVTVAIGNVRAAISVDRDGVFVAAEEPLRFEGRAEGVTVHPSAAIDREGSVHVEPATQLGIRSLQADGSLRVGIPTIPELDLAIPCDGVVAGAPARDPRLVGVEDPRTRIAVDGEVPLFASAELRGAPVAWLGGANRRAIVVGVLERSDRRAASIRIVAEGVVVRAFADPDRVSALEPEPEVWPTPAHSRERQSIPGTEMTLPPGASVFATSDAAGAWGITTVAMQVRTDARADGRIRILEFGADVDPSTTPAPGASRSRRIVRATPAVDPGVIWVGDPASWVVSP